jgi:hypothetical protein
MIPLARRPAMATDEPSSRFRDRARLDHGFAGFQRGLLHPRFAQIGPRIRLSCRRPRNSSLAADLLIFYIDETKIMTSSLEITAIRRLMFDEKVCAIRLISVALAWRT